MSAELLDAVRGLGSRVRELAPAIEAERRLEPGLAQDFGRLGLWRVCVPRSVGGLELPLADQLEIFEELARADGSVGWCAMIGATGGLAYAFLEPHEARSIVDSDPDGCTGGVFAPQGRVTEVDGGVRVRGRWAFASGVMNSARMGLGVMVMDGDAPRVLEGGMPDMRAVLVDSGHYEVVDTWMVSGLRGTGSHDVVIEELFVPAARTYAFLGARAKHDGPLYRFPFFGLLGVCVAGVCLGVARSAIDELVALASTKTATGQRRRLAERSHVQMQVAEAEAELRAARAFFYDAVSEGWRQACAGEQPSLEDRAVLRLAATHAARASARVVDRMYDAGGGTSIYATSRLQRDFRDIHAATQHIVISQPTWEQAGRVLLGVETDVTML